MKKIQGKCEATRTARAVFLLFASPSRAKLCLPADSRSLSPLAGPVPHLVKENVFMGIRKFSLTAECAHAQAQHCCTTAVQSESAECTDRRRDGQCARVAPRRPGRGAPCGGRIERLRGDAEQRVLRRAAPMAVLPRTCLIIRRPRPQC
jgi:hypothetical protein